MLRTLRSSSQYSFALRQWTVPWNSPSSPFLTYNNKSCQVHRSCDLANTHLSAAIPIVPACHASASHHLLDFHKLRRSPQADVCSQVLSLHIWKNTFCTTSCSFQQDKPAESCVSKSEVSVSDNRKIVTISDNGGYYDSFNATWLRQNCDCAECVQPTSGQRKIEPSRLAPEYTIKSAHIQDSNLVLEWHEEIHAGTIPLQFLAKNGYTTYARRTRLEDARPHSAQLGVLPKVAYDEIIESDAGLWQWTKHLNEEGFCLVQDVPKEKTVKEVVERIWTVQSTIYGEVFQVVATPSPINIAYSSEFLGLHMDLIYYESPPGYQFLLCKRFDECCTGGESILVDSWHVAEQMRRQHPEDFSVLTRTPATFQKIHYDRERPVHIVYRRPHVVVDTATGQISNINWAPAFEGPLSIPPEDIDAYYRAYHRFAQMLDAADKVEFRLNEGDILGFNNRRILHSRNSFQLNGGERHLEGCYLNADEVKSRTQVLANRFNDGNAVKHVFNQSSF